MPRIIGGRYEVLGQLGRGGMGTVQKVFHAELEQIRAVKFLSDDMRDKPEVVARFRSEARAMARLRHDHIVRVYDFARDEESGRYYLAMECIDGPTLAQYLRGCGHLDVAEALLIARQVASALAYAHAHGVTAHRDVKPSNIFLKETHPPVALLADFGIAKVDDAEKTGTDIRLASPRYGAPEQQGYRRGKQRIEVDARADIFALGLVLFEMIEGRAFFADLSHAEIIGELVYRQEPLLPEFSREVPPSVVRMISRAISRDPDARHASMSAFLGEIESCLRELDDPDVTHVIGSKRDAAGVVLDQSDDDIAQRIHALQAEQRRRQAQQVRAQAEAARDRAVAADAARLAPAEYEEASGQLREASAALQASQFGEAERLLQEAMRVFGSATDAAIARSQTLADQAREAAREARESAAGRGAMTVASTPWERAEAVWVRVERERTSEPRAAVANVYREATLLFTLAEAAAIAAHRRREVEAQLPAFAELRARAETARAPELAPDPFDRAVRLEDDARGALDRDAFEEAERDLGAARALYEEAVASAAREQARWESTLARERAATARRSAEDVGADRLAPQSFGVAVDAEGRADEALAAGEVSAARESYTRVAEAFEHAAQEARLERARQEAEAARAEAARARMASEEAEAREVAAEDLVSADRAYEAGESALAGRDFAAAVRAFGEARDRYAAAAESARVRAWAREQSRAKALRQSAERARADLRGDVVARERVQAADEAFAAAVELERSTVPERAQVEYQRATRLYEEALEAELRGRADEARSVAASARGVAVSEGAPRVAKAAFEEGDRSLAQGDDALGSGRADEARRAFEEAASRYGRAIATAEGTKARVVEAHRHAEAVKAKAAASGERWAPEILARAETLLAEGVAALVGADLEEAERRFGAAVEAFERALGVAADRSSAAKRAAEASQRTARGARAQALNAGAESDAAASLAEADGRLEVAERALTRADYVDARDAFASATTAFERAAAEARSTAGARAKAARPRAGDDEQTVVMKPRPRAADARVEDRTVVEERTTVAPDADSTSVSDVTATVPPRRARSSAVVPPAAADADRTRVDAIRTPAGGRPAVTMATAGSTATEEVIAPERPRRSMVPLAASIFVVAVVAIGSWSLYSRREVVAPIPEPVVPTAPVTSTPRPAPASPKPTWKALAPADAERTAKVGEIVEFMASLDGGGEVAPSFRWTVDGNEVGKDTSFRLVPELKDEGKTIDVAVVAAIGAVELRNAWRVSVPLANRAPTVVRDEPSGDAVAVAADAKEIRFALEATDPDVTGGHDHLTYVWTRNGVEVMAGPNGTFVLRDPREGDLVTASVHDEAGAGPGPRTWHVRVEAATNHAPRIEAPTPSGTSVRLEAGGTVQFGVQAKDPDKGDRLAYRWTLDGRDVGAAPTWRFATESGATGRHTIAVEVADSKGLKDAREWTVDLAPPAFQLINPVPSGQVALTAGQTRELQVATRGGAGGGVTYGWSVDGETPKRTGSGTFELPVDLAEGSHSVRVAAEDAKGERTDPHFWTVVVRGIPPAIPPAPPPPSPGGQATEADARRWIEEYARAWASRDAGALTRMGEGGANPAALRDWLEKYKEIEVAIVDAKVRSQDSGFVVTFVRKDSDGSNGRVMRQESRSIYLEPSPSGGLRRGAAGR